MPSTEYRTDEEMLAVTRQRAEALARARKRRRVGAGLLGIAVVVGLTALVVGPLTTDEPTVVAAAPGPDATSTTVTREPLTGAEGWVPMAPSVLSARSGAIAVWTGEEMLIWRGEGAFSDACQILDGGELLCGEPILNDGAAYDPVRDTWRALPDAPLPDDQGSDLAYEGAWTGDELVVWGGSEGRGAAYDPATNEWRELAEAPIGPRRHFSLTWTGREIVVHGGVAAADAKFDTTEAFDDGAAYDVATGEWRTISDSGTPRRDHVALAIDGNLLVLGGSFQTGSGRAVHSLRPDSRRAGPSAPRHPSTTSRARHGRAPPCWRSDRRSAVSPHRRRRRTTRRRTRGPLCPIHRLRTRLVPQWSGVGASCSCSVHRSSTNRRSPVQRWPSIP